MNHSVRLPLLAVSMSVLACSVFVGGPPPPEPPVAGAPDALQQLQSDIEAAVVAALVDGDLQLTITQEQLTAFLVSRLARDSHPALYDPQVVLGEDEMIIYGRVRSWILEANAAITARFAIGEAGRPKIQIMDAQLGPLPMPAAVQEAIATALDEALTGTVGPAALGFRLEAIDISPGVMTVSGRLR